MPGRTPAEAVSEYVESIQLAVSCISDAVATVKGGYYPAHRPHTLELNEGSLVRLRGTSRLSLFVQQYYRIVESRAPRTRWTVIRDWLPIQNSGRQPQGNPGLPLAPGRTEFLHLPTPALKPRRDARTRGTPHRPPAHRLCFLARHHTLAHQRLRRNPQARRLGIRPGYLAILSGREESGCLSRDCISRTWWTG